MTVAITDDWPRDFDSNFHALGARRSVLQASNEVLRRSRGEPFYRRPVSLQPDTILFRTTYLHKIPCHRIFDRLELTSACADCFCAPSVSCEPGVSSPTLRRTHLQENEILRSKFSSRLDTPNSRDGNHPKTPQVLIKIVGKYGDNMAVSLPIYEVLRLETFLRLVLRGILRIVIRVDPQASQQPVTRPANPFLSLLKCPPSPWTWAGKLGPRTLEGD